MTSPLTRVPLEYIEGAARTFLARPDVRDDLGITILGESRGAEAALLVAQHFDGALPITDCIAMRPWHTVVGSAINGPDTPVGPEVSSWTLAGEDLPFAALPNGKRQFPWAIELSDGQTAPNGDRMLPIVDLVRVFEAVDEIAPREARIDVSKVSARVHVIAGDDDAMWPAGDALQTIAKQRGDRPDDRRVLVKGAGHYSAPGRRSTAVSEEVQYPIIRRAGGPSDEDALVLDGGDPLHNALLDVAYGAWMKRLLDGDQTPMPFAKLCRS